MGNEAQNVSAGKPKVGGAIFRAAAGTALPTDPTTDLAPAYKCLGYISEDGVANGVEGDASTINAWGGDTVLTIKKSASETYVFTLIESLNIDVQKTVYGEANVIVDEDDVTTISHKPGEDLPLSVFVVEIAMKGNRIKRIVIPNGKVTAVGEVTYKDDAAVGYKTTVSAFTDAGGATATEYISAAAESDGGNNE